MKINANVYLLESAKGAFVYLIDAQEKVLVDTGMPWRGNAILSELRSMNVQPVDIRHILLTHYDVDHISNAAMLQKLTGAAVWASAGEIPYITGEKPRPGFKKYLTKVFRYEVPHDIHAYGESVCTGSVKVIPTPGHTPGHVCLLYGDVLFTGDIVENHKGSLRPYPAGWNWNNELMLESLQELSKLPFRWICTAHGRPLAREDGWGKMLGAL